MSDKELGKRRVNFSNYTNTGHNIIKNTKLQDDNNFKDYLENNFTINYKK